MGSGGKEADVCVVGLGPTGRALAHRAMRAGLRVLAVDPRPERLWPPTFSCWIDELPDWLPATAIASRIDAPTVWTRTAHRIQRPYCVLSKPGLRDALPLDDATVLAGRATRVDAHEVELADGTLLRAGTVFDTRGLPTVGQRRAASAHGIFVDAETAAPMVAEGEGLLLDWRPENGAGPDEPPSFLYAVPLGDGTVIFEETSLGLRGGMPQHELRKRTLNRLAAHGIRLTGEEPSEAAHYPLDQPPPRRGTARAVPFGSRGGMMHPCTGYSVADSLALADTAVQAVLAGADPVAALWPRAARLVYWMRMRGLYGLGRLTTDQSIAMFESFFTQSERGQRALLSAHADYTALGAVLVDTVAHTWPFRWRYDLVGWTNRNRWVGYEFAPARAASPERG
ncbi:lycopene cyclase [Nocardia farcinica]|uniref:Lycopene beta cyclase n=1 Tax=Nocardia farcinica TaxID=37329 RepID=A0A449GNE2_NOCFR|nr:lycopene cyclase family protein [Nocardia farcinica]MBA4857146.1 lycopene cyclase [Nocardia farcinica]MBC9818760.1 lycopene cyclase [Nocardia farcinica]MBF6072156.1 lycopene cyclase [Nocardia farcinica]MBF6232746.1 lycopene cyclase [Nocardia farcinica]MBF6251674.1 lycopene cyclase [Nocardia farcinica]